MFYDNLGQDPDAPTGEKLKDDDYVDSWLISQRNKRETQKVSGPVGNPYQKKMGTPEVEHKVQFRR